MGFCGGVRLLFVQPIGVMCLNNFILCSIFSILSKRDSQ